MTGRAALEVDTLTIRIPIRLQRRGGRKLIITPEGTTAAPQKPTRDEILAQSTDGRTAGGAESRAGRRGRSPTLRSRRASLTPMSAGCSR